jgi:hypothetical protein
MPCSCVQVIVSEEWDTSEKCAASGVAAIATTQLRGYAQLRPSTPMSRVLGSSGAGSVRHRGTRLARANNARIQCCFVARLVLCNTLRQPVAPILARIQLGLSDRGGRINSVDHLVLPLFPGRRCAHINNRRRTDGRLRISLHHLATTGLGVADGRNRALRRAGNCNVRDAQGGLVRARRELSPRHNAELLQS